MNDIPPILHYLPADSPDSLAEWRRLHPRWDIVEWERESCVAMMHTFYPEMVEKYHRFSDSQRIRILRLLLLHRYGGISIDTRLRPLRSLHSWRMARRLVFSEDLSWLAAPPKCEAILVYLRTISPSFLGSSFLGEWFDRERRLWHELAEGPPISSARFLLAVLPPPCPIRRAKRYMRYLAIVLLFLAWKFKNKPVFKVFR
jgi:hypothetical protein